MCKKEHKMENNDFFRYLQIRHRLTEILAEGKEKQGNEVLKVFVTAYISGSGRGVISKLYKSFQCSPDHNTHHVKDKWEREGDINMTVEEWDNICKWQWKTTYSHNWREFGWKSIMRFFITPVQQKHQGLKITCWRLCGSTSPNHHHILWSCPKLLPYWKEIHKNLELIFRRTFVFDFLTLYLGAKKWHQSAADNYLMRILLTAGKKAITKKWLQPDAPTLEDWYNIIHHVYTMERLTFSIKMQSETFIRRWAKWSNYIGPRRPELLETQICLI